MKLVTQESSEETVALFRNFPELSPRLPWASLGTWPTPVDALAGHKDIFIKREDISSPIYGGNKIRTLEAQMGTAKSRGAKRIWATGAYGSNHAIATLLHAPAAGLKAGALLFPQPPTQTARVNLLASLATDADIWSVPHVAALPFAMAALELRSRQQGLDDFIMSPGGANPIGALGHVSAGLEIAQQIADGALPPPETIVLSVGSTCTTAGLMVGLRIAERLGIARAPSVCAVRVTPWPVTAASRITYLARRTSMHLAELIGDIADIPYRELRRMLRVDHRHFGRGYGKPTQSGRAAKKSMADAGGPTLDLVYSAKSAAALFANPDRPLLFWATKSTTPLPQPTQAQLQAAPRGMRRWLAKSSIS